MRRAWRLALSAMLLAALVAPAMMPTATACSVPCGYVYPRLLLDVGERGVAQTLTSDAPIHLEGTLTFTWDITSEGMASEDPANPIVVTFSYPRKPEWLDVSVEPAEIPIPIQPQYIEPSTNEAGAQLVYRYTTPIAVSAQLTGQPVVDAARPPTLLILAQSSESLLYKPGFGVRNLPLDLPEAIVQSGEGTQPLEELRIGEPETLDLGDMRVEFLGGAVTLGAAEPIELWRPASLTARVDGASGPLAGVQMVASVVDEENRLLYTTGLRLPEDGTLTFPFAFPAPGQYRVLVAARPLDGVAADAGFDPFVAEFPVAIPGVEWDALRFPDAFRTGSVEPVNALNGNPNDPVRQWEQRLTFPVLNGADSVSVQAQLGTTQAGAVPSGSMNVEVRGPDGEVLSFGKMEGLSPGSDLRLRGPLVPGMYEVHLFGTGANPMGLAGSEVAVDIGVFYPERPLGIVQADGQPWPLPGGAVPLGTGGMLVEMVPATEPDVWVPFEATFVVRDEAGAIALHPDVVVTVLDATGRPLHTTGLRHPHDGQLRWATTFPAPGTYTIAVFTAPTSEVSGAFWQPASVSFPITIPVPEDGVVQYPETYEATYLDSTSSMRLVPSGADTYAFRKDYEVPVKQGATELVAHLNLMTMTPTQMVDGAGPAALSLSILDPDGNVVAGPSVPTPVEAVAGLPQGVGAPGTYVVRVEGVGYAPVDYSGAMYHLHIMASYPEGPTEAVEGGAGEPDTGTQNEGQRGLPGFGAAALVAAAAVVAGVLSIRRRRR